MVAMVGRSCKRYQSWVPPSTRTSQAARDHTTECEGRKGQGGRRGATDGGTAGLRGGRGEEYGQSPEAEETGDQDGHTRGVVPGGNGAYAVGLAHLGQQQGAAHIEQKGQSETGKYARHAARDAQRVEFAQEQGNHQGGLHGADAAAGFINANGAGANLDDVAMLDGRHAQPAEQLEGRADIEPHQGLDQEGLQRIGPGNSDEEKADGEGQ